MKILIVDDDPIIRLILSESLKNEYEVIIAVDGGEALEMMYNHHPDIVLLDVMMPNLSGYQVLGLIRYEDEFRNTKVAIISGNTSTVKIAEGMDEYNADTYFTKPLNIPQIKDWIKQQI